jgi:hypothetical protein
MKKRRKVSPMKLSKRRLVEIIIFQTKYIRDLELIVFGDGKKVKP